MKLLKVSLIVLLSILLSILAIFVPDVLLKSIFILMILVLVLLFTFTNPKQEEIKTTKIKPRFKIKKIKLGSGVAYYNVHELDAFNNYDVLSKKHESIEDAEKFIEDYLTKEKNNEIVEEFDVKVFY